MPLWFHVLIRYSCLANNGLILTTVKAGPLCKRNIKFRLQLSSCDSNPQCYISSSGLVPLLRRCQDKYVAAKFVLSQFSFSNRTLRTFVLLPTPCHRQRMWTEMISRWCYTRPSFKIFSSRNKLAAFWRSPIFSLSSEQINKRVSQQASK